MYIHDMSLIHLIIEETNGKHISGKCPNVSVGCFGSKCKYTTS